MFGPLYAAKQQNKVENKAVGSKQIYATGKNKVVNAANNGHYMITKNDILLQS
jgi:hypothetical protein